MVLDAVLVISLPLAKVFVSYDAALLGLTVSGFRVYALSFLFMGYAIFGSGFFTALNDGVTSAIISFLRTLVFQIASVMVLPLIWGIDGIWYSVVAAECIGALPDPPEPEPGRTGVQGWAFRPYIP